jgi:hypothetical protein
MFFFLRPFEVIAPEVKVKKYGSSFIAVQRKQRAQDIDSSLAKVFKYDKNDTPTLSWINFHPGVKRKEANRILTNRFRILGCKTKYCY